MYVRGILEAQIISCLPTSHHLYGKLSPIMKNISAQSHDHSKMISKRPFLKLTQ